VIGEIRKGDTVAVERDRSIGGVLLETLKSPEGWYFGQQYPVIYSPGWIEEAPLRPPAQADQGIFLDAQPREIPAIQGLKNSISTLYPAIQLMDPEVESWRARLTTSEMFIFLGHGKSHGLVYADNQLLKAQDFPPESLAHLQVAALIACSTGSTGDSLFRANDLVHGFLAGGTPNVIASNWDVDSKATAELMATFFHSLRNGGTAAAAMFEARKSIFARYSQPYYWAAFSVTGKAN